MNSQKIAELLENRRKYEMKLLGINPEEKVEYEKEEIFLLAEFFQVSPRTIRRDLKYINHLEPKPGTKSLSEEQVEHIKDVLNKWKKKPYHSKKELEEVGLFEYVEVPKNWDYFNGKKLAFGDMNVRKKIEHAVRCLLFGFKVNELKEYFRFYYKEEGKNLSEVELKLIKRLNAWKCIEKRQADISKLCMQIYEEEVEKKGNKQGIRDILAAYTGYSGGKIYEQSRTPEETKDGEKELTQTQKERGILKRTAYDLWMLDIPQKKIAEKLGHSRETVGIWIREVKEQLFKEGKTFQMPETRRFIDTEITADFQSYEEFVSAFDYRKKRKELEAKAKEKENELEYDK